MWVDDTATESVYQVVGTHPDGGTVRFVPDDPADWDLVPGPHKVHRNATGGADLRLEGIDGLLGVLLPHLDAAAVEHVEVVDGSIRISARTRDGVWLVLAEKFIRAGQATVRYSLMTPPAQRVRRTRKTSRSVTSGGSGLRGAAPDKAMCE